MKVTEAPVKNFTNIEYLSKCDLGVGEKHHRVQPPNPHYGSIIMIRQRII